MGEIPQVNNEESLQFIGSKFYAGIRTGERWCCPLEYSFLASYDMCFASSVCCLLDDPRHVWAILKCVNSGDRERASVTEWSKVLRSGRSVFARVGSSPTACIFIYSLLMDRILTDWHEVLYYDAIYASVTNESQNELSGKEAVTFLKKSELPVSDIKSVGGGGY